MILESHIGDKHVLPIDCESDSGLNKGGNARSAHPDKVVENMGVIIGLLHAELSRAAAAAGVTDGEIEFGIRVDMGANVSIAKVPSEGQLRVKLRL